MPDSQYAALVEDMRLALLSEFGAHVVYSRLALRADDEELAGVLQELASEELTQIESLRALMQRLGGRPKERSIRRWLAARALVACRRFFGVRFVLRVCLDAEWAVSRWYAKYAAYLVRVGEQSEAEACEALALTKRRHSRVLKAWVDLR